MLLGELQVRAETAAAPEPSTAGAVIEVRQSGAGVASQLRGGALVVAVGQQLKAPVECVEGRRVDAFQDAHHWSAQGCPVTLEHREAADPVGLDDPDGHDGLGLDGDELTAPLASSEVEGLAGIAVVGPRGEKDRLSISPTVEALRYRRGVAEGVADATTLKGAGRPFRTHEGDAVSGESQDEEGLPMMGGRSRDLHRCSGGHDAVTEGGWRADMRGDPLDQLQHAISLEGALEVESLV